MVGRLRKFYIRKAVGGDLNLKVLIGGVKGRDSILWGMGSRLRKRGDENFFWDKL
jgi:hypothetical protein